MNDLYDVIIAGAGPVGLMLANELKLADVSVLVLESNLKPESSWKVWPLGMRGLNTLAIETLYRRGLLSKFMEPGPSPNEKPVFHLGHFGGHFAGITVDVDKVELGRWKYRLDGPALVPGLTTMQRIESVLTERAEILGVKILRGNGVTKIAAQDDVSVTVEAGENQLFHGKWLVGCDGGRSVVRKAAGFEFEGTEPRYTGYSARCDLDPPNKLKPGFNITDNGLYMGLPPDGMHILDFSGAAFDRTQEVTQEHLQEVLNRVTGSTDVTIKKIHVVSSSTDRCKQVSTYRKGRILLAGDAAHIHSPLGGQGMNLGMGDAMNLGWKLAATVRQESKSNGPPANLALLNTYESERHAVAAWVLGWTRAQVSSLVPDSYGPPTRAILRDLINTPDGANLLIDRVWGLTQRYHLGDGDAHSHPLVGCTAPDFELHDGSRLGSRLESGHGLLIDFQDDGALKELVVGKKYEARVDYIGMGAKDTCGLRALLIRPDGFVAWVTEGNAEPDLNAASAALEQWFGS